MTVTAMIMMIVILGAIWGGALVLVNRAYRREKAERVRNS